MSFRTRPVVSVNIPVYNGEKTIAATINSILAQSFTDFELIVVNDCSKDSTPQILNSFTDPRLRVIHQEQNQGISRTRNRALKSSLGDYIAVLDADDLALPKRLERQLATLEADPPLDGVFAWIQLFTENSRKITDSYRPCCDSSRLRETILFESPFAHSTAFLRRNALGEGYREDLACAEDYAKWLELVFAGKKLGVVREILGAAWRHSPTHYSREKMRSNVQALHAHYFARILSRPLSPLESEIHWALYEFVDWTPQSRDEAHELLQQARQWISTLGRTEFSDPSIDRARLTQAAAERLPFLYNQAVPALGFEVLRHAHDLPLKQQIKLLARSVQRNTPRATNGRRGALEKLNRSRDHC